MIGIEYKGRLGNNMFQYALAQLIKKKRNFNFQITSYKPHRRIIKQWFNLSKGDLFEQDFEYSKLLKEDRYGPLNSSVDDFFSKIQDDTLIKGYWQSEKFFDNNEDFVKNLFAKKSEQYNWYNRKSNVGENECIVHIRGGDYFEWGHHLEIRWYRDAMEEMKKINPSIKFSIVTDDNQFVEENFSDILNKSDRPQCDFHKIMISKYKIISNSTFSWWASWLGASDSTVIAPENWLNNNGRYNEFLSKYKFSENFLGSRTCIPFNIKSSRFMYL